MSQIILVSTDKDILGNFQKVLVSTTRGDSALATTMTLRRLVELHQLDDSTLTMELLSKSHRLFVDVVWEQVRNEKKRQFQVHSAIYRIQRPHAMVRNPSPHVIHNPFAEATSGSESSFWESWSFGVELAEPASYSMFLSHESYPADRFAGKSAALQKFLSNNNITMAP